MDNETATPAPYKTLETGAPRSARVAFDDPAGAPARFDLCTSEGQLAWARAMSEMKGMPFSELINRVEAHLAAHKAGDRSEDHVRHSMANLGLLACFERHRADLDARRPAPPAASPQR